MTAAGPTPQPELGAPAHVEVEAYADTRIAQLAAQYDVAKAEAKKAAEALAAITDAIKVELVKAAPGSNDIRLESPLLAQPLRLFPVVSQRLDTKRMKAEQPALYDAYLAKPTTAWQLRAVTS